MPDSVLKFAYNSGRHYCIYHQLKTQGQDFNYCFFKCINLYLVIQW